MAQAAMGPFWLDEFYRKQAQTKAATGQDPNLASVYGAVYGAQEARYQNAQEMARIQTQKDQFGQTLAQRQSEFGVTSDLAKQKLEQDQWAGVSSGAMNLALIEGITSRPGEGGVFSRGYTGAKDYLTGGGTPTTTPYTTSMAEGAQIGTGTAMTSPAGFNMAASEYTTGAGYTADVAMGAEGSAGTTAAAGGTSTWGGAAMPAAGWGAAGGAIGSYLGREHGQNLPYTGGKNERSVVGGALGGFVAGGLATSWSGPGMVIGAIAGGIVGAVSASVICTELLRQGFVSQEMIDLEHKYHNFDWATYWGYRLWADPIVIKMSKSRRFARLVALFGVPFLNEIAHRIDPQRKGSRFGALMLRFGVPFCKWNFNRVARKYRKLTAWHQGIRENCNG